MGFRPSVCLTHSIDINLLGFRTCRACAMDLDSVTNTKKHTRMIHTWLVWLVWLDSLAVAAISNIRHPDAICTCIAKQRLHLLLSWLPAAPWLPPPPVSLVLGAPQGMSHRQCPYLPLQESVGEPWPCGGWGIRRMFTNKHLVCIAVLFL